MGDEKALRGFKKDHLSELRHQQYRQFRFDGQWRSLREYASDAGVGLIGDLPIYAPRDSQDVWAARDKFKFDKQGSMLAQSGVPPDYFSKSGQLWRTPVYNWKAHSAEGFEWWIRRLEGSLRRVDMLRIDHFRALHNYWEVPARAKTARHGKWMPGPGDAFFKAVCRKLGNAPFIAEDLGMITEEVYGLRDRWNLPGMRVLQFAFDGGAANIHLPHHYSRHSIVYSGTHDNDTTAGWHKKASREQRRALNKYCGQSVRDAHLLLQQLAYSSVAALAVIPMQDVLGLGSDARQNLPGGEVKGGNFRWKLMPGQLTMRAAENLHRLMETYGRLPKAGK